MILVEDLRKEDGPTFGVKAANLGELNAISKLTSYFSVPKAVLVGKDDDVDGLTLKSVGIYAPVIVRSNFVDEDGAKESKAGLYESYVVESNHELRESVRKLLAIDSSAHVIVQKFIKAKSSGEYFTYDPEKLKAEPIVSQVEGNFGTVDGTKTVQRNDTTKALNYIADDLLVRFGTHLDIEWVIDRNYNIWIVQCRPITAKATKKVELLHGIGILTEYRVGTALVCEEYDPKIKIPKWKDIVLVTDHTNRKWEKHMRAAKAIITNHGTTTCHAAIFSREIGLPGVIGTVEATSLIKTGDKVYVNTLSNPGFGIVHKEVIPNG